MLNASCSSDLVDTRTFQARPNQAWPVHVIRASAITEALARLQLGAAGENGRREVLAVHPMSREPGLGLAPSTAVSFGVLLPGERTRARRRNASSFSMALAGTGVVHVDGQHFPLTRWDSWNTPGMRTEILENTGANAFVYISYSNAPVLQKLEVLFEELDPPTAEAAERERAVTTELAAKTARAKQLAGDAIAIGTTGAMLLPYEHLIDPDFIESRALLWKWSEVGPHLGLVRSLGQGYTGRPLWCLYNPATERRNGTTFSFFATITSAAPNLIGPAHRHISAAINFILEGGGWSIVDGQRVEWSAGDIMLSAPGWAPHGHAMGPEGSIVLTVQDHPLHIGAESLIWQEDLKAGPILTLGTQAGFQTNLAQFRASR